MAEPDLTEPPKPRRRGERLVALVLAGGLALNYPLLAVFDSPARVLGIPVAFLYLFLVWLGFIVLAAMVLESRPRPLEGEDGAPPNGEA
jgi:hypothetical protein